MDSEKNIEQLLERYWNCETSLEEEQQLREYFRGKDLPRQWQDTSQLFRYFDLQKKASVKDAGFDAEVMKKIRTASPAGKNVKMFSYLARIAAGVVVVAAATFLVRQEIIKNPDEVADTFSDPKMALEETKKALMMISNSIGRAETEAKKINLLNEAEQKIGEQQGEEKEQAKKDTTI